MKSVIVIGEPLTDNHIYATFSPARGKIRRIPTKKLKSFKTIARSSVRKPWTPYTCAVCVEVRLYFSRRSKRDLQGHMKALFDSMNGILYEDDSQIVRMGPVMKFYDKEFPRSEIKVYPLEPIFSADKMFLDPKDWVLPEYPKTPESTKKIMDLVLG